MNTNCGGARVNRNLRTTYPEGVSGPRCCHSPNRFDVWAGGPSSPRRVFDWTREMVEGGPSSPRRVFDRTGIMMSRFEFFMPIACDRTPLLGKDHVSVLSMRSRHGDFDQEHPPSPRLRRDRPVLRPAAAGLRRGRRPGSGGEKSEVYGIRIGGFQR